MVNNSISYTINDCLPKTVHMPKKLMTTTMALVGDSFRASRKFPLSFETGKEMLFMIL